MIEQRGTGSDGLPYRRAGTLLPERRAATAEELLLEGEAVEEEPFSLQSPSLEAALESASGAELSVVVSVWVPAMDEVPTFGFALLEGLLDGRLATYEDVEALRDELAFEHAAASADALAAARAYVEAAGGRVVGEAAHSGTLEVVIADLDVPALASVPDVVALGMVTAAEPDAYNWYTYGWAVGDEVTGDEVEELIQSRQFYRHAAGGFDGESAPIALIEDDANTLFTTHPGFSDSSGGTRVQNCDIGGGTCADAGNFAGGQAHAEAVASVLVGDITGGQDAGYPTPAAQRQRSGVARGSSVMATRSNQRVALENFLTSAAFPGKIASQSASAITVAPDCTGNSDWARTVNATFESGVAWFKSAGNYCWFDNGSSLCSGVTPADCTVGDPAAAIGAFAVSAYHPDSDADGVDEVYSFNSRGGTGASNADGRNRAIIGAALPVKFLYPYPNESAKWDSDTSSWYRYGTDWAAIAGDGPDPFCCTSAATPAAAGAAALFRDWHTSEVSSSIDDPALLYTWLLLMGDRSNENFSPWDSYSNVTGAGRLRLRTFDDAGMDGPWDSGVATLCVGAQQTVSLTVIGQALDADVDVFRVVAWWYDRRHDNGIGAPQHDKVTMSASLTDGSGTTTYTSNSLDNRQRIHVNGGVAGKAVQLSFSGADVSADNEGCGTNSMRVFLAWFAEDSDRDDTFDLDVDGFEVLNAVRVAP